MSYFLKDFYLNANYGNIYKDFYGRNWTRGLMIGTDLLKYSEKNAYGMNVGLGWGQTYLSNGRDWYHLPFIDLGFVLIFGV